MSPAHDSSSSSSSSSSASSDSDSEVEVRQPPPPKSFPDASRKRKRREVQDESAQGEGEGEGAGSETQGDALSHAALRRQKKKQKTMTTDATKPPTQSTTSQVRKNSVWVGNLSFKTTSNRLQEFFDGAGEVTRVHMPTKSAVGDGKGMRGENRGFAYVDFATPEAKKRAITYSEKLLDGRKLLIKDGTDFTGRPTPSATEPFDAPTAEADSAIKNKSGTSKTAQKILRAQKQPAGPTLFMGNLGFETTEESIREMIEAHQLSSKPRKDPEDATGKNDVHDGNEGDSAVEAKRLLRKVRMGTFEDSGLCKGFAFLDFVSPEDATAALVNPRNYQLNGRKLVLEYASPDAVRRGGGSIRPVKGKEHSRRVAPRTIRKQARDAKRSNEGEPVAAHLHSDAARPRKPPSVRPRSLPSAGRAKPGAALADAHRERVAIVQSEGKKTVF